MFWILTALLTLIAALFVAVPLWRSSHKAAFEAESLRKSENIALFHERRDELESELSLGNLEQEQFESLVLELQQNLLSDVEQEESQTKGSSSQSAVQDRRKLVIALPLIMLLAMPVLAYSLYVNWGYIDDVELMDLFQRTVNNIDDPEESQALVVSIGQAVQENEDQPWAWYFLAENFASLGMFTEAEIAYTQSAGRMDESPEKALVLGRVALAKYINAEFKFTPEILEVVEQARAINPGEISILQLLAADAEERQDFEEAIEYWRLLIQASPNSEQAQLLRQNIAAAQQLLNPESGDADSGPTIEVNLSLADGIEFNEDLSVFVAARNAEREGMPPLAALQLRLSSLPTTIRLTNASAVGPFNLSAADAITVSALISSTGAANPVSGDYRVISDVFAHAGQHTVISLVISEQVP